MNESREIFEMELKRKDMTQEAELHYYWAKELSCDLVERDKQLEAKKEEI